MNSRWQANKIGLINFWYYDEQEFPFVKGRMLLRGSNGSGKSVTMQSVVPLLLDGNLSPERLDPFGSRDRKMSSYLLEEDDPREERTGYLYLEFKRRESETYLTIGMGIRARRGKPLDKWYFSLTDGRRVGRDFFLYKETGEKMTLSKKELTNRIGTGGCVLDRQNEYMEYVNRQIFGFETAEEYKEMIDLLIQLRTPKLSKDFKPSVINDILSDSLQPLSDEDLRPMSEAIENMDTMNMNLKAREEGKQAAEKIWRVLNRYNKKILYEKSGNYEKNTKKCIALQKEEKDCRQEIDDCKARQKALEQELTDLSARHAAMEKEVESMNQSDAVSLKKRELELADRIEENKKLLHKKEQKLEEKQEKYRECEAKYQQEADNGYQKEQELLGLLEEMQEAAEEMSFEEHSFFMEELKESLGEGFSFEAHESQFARTEDGIRQGLEILQKADRHQRDAEELLQKKEKQQREADAARRRVNELEAVLVQAGNEWKERLYSWNGSNRELVLSETEMRGLSVFGDNYNEQSDFSVVRNTVADIWIARKGNLEAVLRRNRDREQELAAAYEEREAELAQWENHREPEPDRSGAVIRNRQHLQEKGIPYQEFYKLLEFGEELNKEACDRLEEALLHMGILDALVIEEQYRAQVLSADRGCCDRYLFVQSGRAEKSILDVLDLNDSVNDIFLNQRITGILQNISYDGSGATGVLPDGTYQMGVVTGTVTGEYEAGFLGTQAREQNRLSRIAACREAMALLETERISLEEERNVLEGRMENLGKEYQALPDDEDLRVARRMLEDGLHTAQRLEEAVRELEEKLREVSNVLSGLRKEGAAIAEKLYLPCTLDTFVRAEAAAQAYSRQLILLKTGQALYLEKKVQMEILRENMETLDLDMDEIRYDTGNTGRALKKDEEERASVLRQLSLTDYAQIESRLNECAAWLKEYPTLLQCCVEEKTTQQNRALHMEEKLKQTAEQIKEYAGREAFLRKCYEAETELAYVELPDERKNQPGWVREFLEPECGNMELDSIIRELNRVYFENRSFLNDYQPNQTELFEELDKDNPYGCPSAKRLDIMARYQGIKISFLRLLQYLEEEIKELRDLIKAGDRELFEDILANTVSRKIRGKINSSNTWVAHMNSLMNAMNTSSGLKLSLKWRSRTAETEDQLDTRDLVELLKKDYRLMREEEAERLSRHFRSKVEEARRHAKDSGGMISFYQVMKETLDYRQWFEFQLFAQKSGQKIKELTNSVFGTFSGGEKAMSMYVPLFSAVVAKYQGGRADAPRLISLDEAFAGVDNKNIRDMFRLMTEFEFDFIINSQVLWGDCDTLDALGIYQLLRPENARFVTVMAYLWNGHSREMMEDERAVEGWAQQYGG